MSKYPKDYPVFRVVSSILSPDIIEGDIVGGTIVENGVETYIAVYAADDFECYPYFATGSHGRLVELEPLTPLAADMLAVVRERQSI